MPEPIVDFTGVDVVLGPVGGKVLTPSPTFGAGELLEAANPTGSWLLIPLSTY
jgi:hypothetical protein